jgi:hypothetical protein
MPNISLIQYFLSPRLLDSSRDALFYIPFDSSLHCADTRTMSSNNVNTFGSSIIHSNYLWTDLLWHCHDSSTLMHKLNSLIYFMMAPSCTKLLLLWIMSTVFCTTSFYSLNQASSNNNSSDFFPQMSVISQECPNDATCWQFACQAWCKSSLCKWGQSRLGYPKRLSFLKFQPM